MSTKFRISQLQQLAARALDELALGQNSARVREVPDVRTIRYYTTLGLLDRPLEMRGRTAFYGPRHLLQLMAIKRMQSEGRSLVEIQQELAGADDAVLHAKAHLGAGGLSHLERWLRESSPEALDDLAQSPERTRGVEPSRSEPGRPADTDAQRPATQVDEKSFRPAPAPVPVPVPVPVPAPLFWQTQPRITAGGAAVTATTKHAVPIRPAAVLALAPGVSLLLEGIDSSQLDERSLLHLRPAITGLWQALQSVGLVADTNPESMETE